MRIKKTVLLAVAGSMAMLAPAEERPAAPRPKVGLVLGGGGALGIAHVGVLRVLEEQHVPVDCICGSSMGAIIGGLYASGMSPDEIEAFLLSLDWNEVLLDEPPRRELYFRRKLESQRYLVTTGLGRHGLKVGTGLASGQKLNNLLQLQVQRSATITDFNQLPIPYRAVATDLQAGGAYEIDHGNLARAMRASMAVPGAFTAVEIDGHLLVDGGIVDNLPVDVARAMGADVIIAVDVGAAADKADPAKLKTIGGILSRSYAIVRRSGQVEQFRQADIGLQPDLEGFSSAQFARVAEFVPKGEAAARAKLAEIRQLSVGAAEYEVWRMRQRRAPPQAIRIESVVVSGNQRVSEQNIRGRIYSATNTLFNPGTVERDLMRIYGIGEFEQVLYRLEQETGDTGTLRYEVTEDPAGPLYLSAGLNLRSDFQNDSDWNLLLNLTRRSIGQRGAEWRNETVVGSTRALFSEFYQPLDHSGIFYVAPTAGYRSERQDLYIGKRHVAEYNVTTAEARCDLGIQLRSYAELRAGPVWGNGRGEVETGLAGLPTFDDDYVGPAVQLVVDRKDRTYFAREGYYFKAAGFFPDGHWGGDASFNKLSLDFTKTHSIDNHTVSLDLQYGADLGSDLPGYAQFTLGGPDSFAGLAQDQFRGSALGVASLGYGYRLRQLPSQLGRGIYAVARFDMGNVWEDHMDSDLRYGAIVGIGADLAVGPLYLTYGHADGGYDSVYFSLGSDF